MATYFLHVRIILHIQRNCIVTLDYTVFDTKNTLLDSGETPLRYLHGGYGEIFDKIENTLEGKNIGESIRVLLNPKESFGEYKEDLVLVEARHGFEEDIAVGEHVEMLFNDDDQNDELLITYTVTDIQEDKVILDANHPLAGSSIIFDATVIGIREASSEELDSRLEHEPNS